jgi:hypothetical protein
VRQRHAHQPLSNRGKIVKIVEFFQSAVMIAEVAFAVRDHLLTATANQDRVQLP